MHTYEMFSGNDLLIAEKILRRRYQMLVHSNIYYGKGKNLISDYQFDAWGKELAQLQSDYPDISDAVEWADAFKDWTGDTGAFLPYESAVVEQIARKLLIYVESKSIELKQPKPAIATGVKAGSSRRKLF